ncbi:NAD(P)/FAD-dependent oxidoreductase [Arcobacter defluvii]|uniref:FAD-dependent oxidoreductase n=1 Tax=Arcobacter defluvii TaxID=873191 RepID=A0AAE7BFT5_9BACT|nr:FAD-dependent oxidoreductase [Arcobacter defluvii]QKF76944.1 FAD-dependent oxidoreductase [Arcobacter defluvii]RXI33716.1 FAD-dependent oxidoreductase [Arcobacter defluvii]
MKRDIIIIGAGIMGLTTAYELLKAGRKVTIIDESDITDSTSFGNAGLLSAFDKGPLANPGIVFNTLKLMIKGESPVNIHPTLDTKIYKWLWKFVNSANKDRLKRTLALFEKYGHISNDAYEKMQNIDGLDLDFHRKGMLSVFTEQKSYDKKLLDYAIKNDDVFEIIEKNKIKEFIPCITNDAKGAIHFKRNTHFDPKRTMLELKRYLKENGAEFILNERISHIKYSDSKIESISSALNTYEADTYIMSTGHQTHLADKVNQNLMMTPAKGYSITFKMPKELQPVTSTLFSDLFIVMTPRRDDVRITSKLEIGSTNHQIVKKQIESIKENFKKYTVPFIMEDIIEWTGFRPLTPNDMPLIGRDEKYKNLIYGMGLGWLGMTFGPALASILKDFIVNDLENKNSDDILLFSGFYQGKY